MSVLIVHFSFFFRNACCTSGFQSISEPVIWRGATAVLGFLFTATLDVVFDIITTTIVEFVVVVEAYDCCHHSSIRREATAYEQ